MGTGTKERLTIATEHSLKRTEETQAINLELMGGDPYFAFIWINDTCYTVSKKPRGFEIVKTQ